jgi:serine/threonine protein kinase
MPLAAGDRIGPYQVIAPIGQGGMGEVYRAQDLKLQREVALKILPDHFSSDPQRRVRFEHEARVLATLTHQNVAVLYGLEGTDGQLARCLRKDRDRRYQTTADLRIGS